MYKFNLFLELPLSFFLFFLFLLFLTPLHRCLLSPRHLIIINPRRLQKLFYLFSRFPSFIKAHFSDSYFSPFRCDNFRQLPFVSFVVKNCLVCRCLFKLWQAYFVDALCAADFIMLDFFPCDMVGSVGLFRLNVFLTCGIVIKAELREVSSLSEGVVEGFWIFYFVALCLNLLFISLYQIPLNKILRLLTLPENATASWINRKGLYCRLRGRYIPLFNHWKTCLFIMVNWW